MKNRNIILISVLFGLLTCFLVYNYITGVEKSLNNIQYGEVIVTKTDLAAKTLLTRDMLEIKKMPAEYIHPLAVRSMDQAIGNITTSPLIKGDEVLNKQISKSNESKNGLSYIIPPGKRAVTVAVDQVSGLADLVKPGDHVDVAATVNIPDASGQKEIPYSLIVLQDIQVLAVGRTLEAKSDDKAAAENKTVTVAVTVEQARPLVLASQKGSIRLMLRSPVDSGTTLTVPFKATDFLR